MFATTRRKAVVVVAVALAVTAVLLWEYTRGDLRPGGPLRGAPPHGYALTVPVGGTFTDAMESLVLHGDRPATLNSVELVGAPGLQIVGFKLATPDRRYTLEATRNWPPRDPDLDPATVIPGPGATIRPHVRAGWELLLGLKVTKPGPLWRDGIRINYTVDGRDYSKMIPAELVLCTHKYDPAQGERCKATDNPN